MTKKKITGWMSGKGEDIGDDIGPVAWCHGAGGILLSRLKCLENVEDNRWKERFEKDIRRAQMKLKPVGGVTVGVCVMESAW